MSSSRRALNEWGVRRDEDIAPYNKGRRTANGRPYMGL